MCKSILGVVVVAASLAMAGPANAAFTGPFALGNWSFESSPGNDGYVSLSAPGNFTLFGGDNGVDLGTADFTITATATGQASFHWRYATDDLLTHSDCAAIAGSFCDPAYVVVNGVETQLSFSDPDSGDAVISLAAGDVFGFRVRTADGLYGRGKIKVSEFSFAPTGTSVPEPATVALFGFGLAVLGLARRRKV